MRYQLCWRCSRPFLVLASDLLTLQDVLERVAVAVEMAHHSLLHDDLPVWTMMTSAEVNRHAKKFDEATAIKGDGLISLALKFASTATHQSAEIVPADPELASDGAQGMVGAKQLVIGVAISICQRSLGRAENRGPINYACMSGAILEKLMELNAMA